MLKVSLSALGDTAHLSLVTYYCVCILWGQEERMPAAGVWRSRAAPWSSPWSSPWSCCSAVELLPFVYLSVSSRGSRGEGNNVYTHKVQTTAMPEEELQERDC